MSGQLSRLQAFLAGAGNLEVVAPPADVRPDYFVRFARLAGATLMAAQVAAVVAPAPAHAAAPAPPAPATVLPAEETVAAEKTRIAAAMRSVQDLSARYLSAGRSPTSSRIVMIDPEKLPDEGPLAFIEPGEVCRIEGIRIDYSRTDPRLARMADTPGMRAFVLIHESMHCRLGPALMNHVAQSTAPMAYEFAVRFNESSADAYAVLTLARKDGIPAALEVLDRVTKVREAEMALPDSEGHHDSRDTLQRVRSVLERTPERLDSDDAAFSLAITEALAGASTALERAQPKEYRAYLQSADCAADMQRFHGTVEEMARGYLEGAHGLGAPKVILNNLVMAPATPARMSPWGLLAKLRPVEHGFTAATLRKDVEEITRSLGRDPATSAPSKRAIADYDDPTPVRASPAGSPERNAVSIGRLRSRLDGVYSDVLHSTGASELTDPAADHEDLDRPGL
ncbi:hypothetical protein ACWV27_26570 (plasmid) [Massilia varians]